MCGKFCNDTEMQNVFLENLAVAADRNCCKDTSGHIAIPFSFTGLMESLIPFPAKQRKTPSMHFCSKLHTSED